MDNTIVDAHQRALDSSGLKSNVSQSTGPNTIGILLSKVGFSNFGRSTAEKTREVLTEIVQNVNAPEGWIDATVREGKVGSDYLDMYNNTPSVTHAVVRELRGISGELETREVKPIEDSWKWADYKATLNMGSSHIEGLGIVLSNEEGKVYSYRACSLRELDLKAL